MSFWKWPAFPRRVQISLRQNWERVLRLVSGRPPGTSCHQTMEEVAESSEQMPEWAGWAMTQGLIWTGRQSLRAGKSDICSDFLLQHPWQNGSPRANISHLTELPTLLLLLLTTSVGKTAPPSSFSPLGITVPSGDMQNKSILSLT